MVPVDNFVVIEFGFKHILQPIDIVRSLMTKKSEILKILNELGTMMLYE